MITVSAPEERQPPRIPGAQADGPPLYLAQLLPPSQVHEVLTGTTADTLAAWRKRGIGPRYVQAQPRGTVWYRVSDLLAWAEEHTHDPAAGRLTDEPMKVESGSGVASTQRLSAPGERGTPTTTG